MIPALILGAGLAVGAAVGWLARRWPQVEAPRVSGEKIVEEVRQHPKLADHLRRHFNPKTETGIALIVGTAVVIAAAVGIGVLLIMVRTHAGLAALDGRAARFGAAHATHASTTILRAVTNIGGTGGSISIAVAATLIELARRRSGALPVFMLVVVGGHFAMSNLIKAAVERARPDLNRLTGFAGPSFPSGHSTAAAATLAAVALIMTRGRSRRTKQYASAVAAGVAAMVAATRVFLGVHWFTDVLAGLLLGWGWFALVSIAFGGRLLQFGLPIEAAEKAADILPASVEPHGAGSV